MSNLTWSLYGGSLILRSAQSLQMPVSTSATERLRNITFILIIRIPLPASLSQLENRRMPMTYKTYTLRQVFHADFTKHGKHAHGKRRIKTH